MLDVDIRRAMNATLLAKHHQCENTLVVPEMAICNGKARVDVAVINGELCGYEIKSTRDTLHRLDRQIAAYNSVFDRVTIVLSPKHLAGALDTIPDWWGVELALAGSPIEFLPVRSARYNDDVKAAALVQLLWRGEALEILENVGGADGFRSRPRRYVWTRLAEIIVTADLRPIVRERLKLRQNWRADPSSFQSDD